ncbi:MAG: translesion error-prone DNA polymerase V autoproteolytic subunit [Gammaproteobacteria bacterium]|nr:translesion error-prone DNA polymerase V autoproteolytic subunit [Gammaproteobacteria bacterium]
MTQNSWGGPRPGSGRKPLSSEPTVTLRVPVSHKETVVALVQRLKSSPGIRIPSWLEVHALAEQPPFLAIPLMSHSVRAGFPSPADDYIEKRIDLNEELIQHREATFFLRVRGHSMVGAGIDDGDELIVDRAISPAHGRIVVAVVDGELTVKRFFQREGVVKLVAESAEFADIEFKDGQEMVIWGVVTKVIKSV